MTKALFAMMILGLSLNASASLKGLASCHSEKLDLLLQSNGGGNTVLATVSDASGPDYSRQYSATIAPDQFVEKLSSGTKLDPNDGQGGMLLVKYDGSSVELQGDFLGQMQCADLQSDNVDGKLDAMGN